MGRDNAACRRARNNGPQIAHIKREQFGIPSLYRVKSTINQAANGRISAFAKKHILLIKSDKSIFQH